MERVRAYFSSKSWQTLRPVLVLCAVIVGAWRAVLEILNQLLPRLLHNMTAFYPPYLGDAHQRVLHTMLSLGRWAHWDGYLFLEIAAHGYHSVRPGIPELTAFFPAFPWLAGGIGWLLHVNPLLVGLALNVALSFALAVAVYKLAEVMTERYAPEHKRQLPRIALLSVLFLFIYPSSLFFAAFYADALQALAFTLALYYALRGRYAWSGLWVAVSMTTKTLGVALVAAIVVQVLTEARLKRLGDLFRWRVIRPCLLVGAGAFVGLALYMAYLWYRFGDPLLFYKAQHLWNRQNSVGFIKTLYEIYYQHILHPSYYGWPYNYLLMLLVMALPFAVLALSVWYARKSRAYWLPVLCFIVLLLPLLSGIMQSLNRYVLCLTPLPVALATLLVRWKVPLAVIVVLMVISAGFLLYFAGGFLQGNYFAG